MTTIPIIILGGADGHPGDLPEDAHVTSLSGIKGADLMIDGRPMVCTVERRIRETRSFGPVYLAGPARVYRSICPDVELIDTNADFGTNIERALRTVGARHPGGPVAFITCDILPGAATLDAMAEDFRQAEPCDLWFAVVRVPENRSELGASQWKPTYRLLPRAGGSSVDTLGGHLVVVRPHALRLDFLCRLFRHTYATRNHSVASRRTVIVQKILGSLLAEDLRRLFSLRRPGVTWRTLVSGIRGATKLRRGTITLAELERVLADVLIDADHIREHGRRVRVSMVDRLSLALDIDTEEEAGRLGRFLKPAALRRTAPAPTRFRDPTNPVGRRGRPGHGGGRARRLPRRRVHAQHPRGTGLDRSFRRARRTRRRCGHGADPGRG